ncbi:hypothetical protein Landi51_12348 [Colletotrichum acutatum]
MVIWLHESQRLAPNWSLKTESNDPGNGATQLEWDDGSMSLDGLGAGLMNLPTTLFRPHCQMVPTANAQTDSPSDLSYMIPSTEQSATTGQLPPVGWVWHGSTTFGWLSEGLGQRATTASPGVCFSRARALN